LSGAQNGKLDDVLLNFEDQKDFPIAPVSYFVEGFLSSLLSIIQLFLKGGSRKMWII